MITVAERDAAYHCGIGDLLNTAYQRDFSILEMGKCKTKFLTFDEWYKTLNQEQKTELKIIYLINLDHRFLLPRKISGNYLILL